MKFCPQCDKRYSEVWLSFCSDDGTMLVEELSPPADPNWNPHIREPQVDLKSEQETQWLPPERSGAPAWVAPDERPPMAPAWQPPPPPRPLKPPSQGLAMASLITSVLGLFLIGCFGPVPGIIGLVLGLVSLSQIKKSPESHGGRPLALAGVIVGAINIALFFLLMILWFFMAISFG